MRKLPCYAVLLTILVVAALFSATRPAPSEAKGYGLTVTPESGQPGASVVLAGDFWPPNVDVQIMVGFTASADAEPTEFVGPIAATRPDAKGHWSVGVVVQSWGRMRLPRAPGFINYHAVGARSAGGSNSPAEGIATTSFILTLNGHRPDGAGGVQLTMTAQASPSRYGWLDWEPAGSPLFYFGRGGSYSFPFDTRIERLRNGDWDLVVAMAPGGLHPTVADGATIVDEQATLCFPSSASCAPRPGPVTALRVHIEDGKIVPVRVVFAPSPSAPQQVSSARAAPQLPRAGGGVAQRRRDAESPVALAVVGALAIIAGAAVARRPGARRA